MPKIWELPKESKFWEDVNEGDDLPEMPFGPLTVKSFFVMYAGTRDPNPPHHNREYMKSTGSRDIFATTPWHQALFARFVTDWSGPDSDFRATSLRMGIQVCPGDSLVVNGKIGKKFREGDDYRVQIDLTSTSQLGVAARASATIAMPSREGGQVKLLKDVQKLKVTPYPDMPEWAKPNMNNPSPKSGPQHYPISATQIMYYCDMVENANPLYYDTEYARNSRHQGLICPPPSLMIWGFGPPSYTTDMDNPEGKPWPPQDPSRRQGGGMLEPPHAKLTIATDLVQEYGVPLKPGDQIYSSGELVNCSSLKKTHLGFGYFMTNLTTSYNQRDEVVANALFTLFRYGVPEEEAAKVLAAKNQ